MSTDFNEWFNGLEGFHIKSERFYESLTAFSNDALAISMVKWLEAAFEAGRVIEREACAKVCEDLMGPIEVYNPKYVYMMDCAFAIRARGET
jgi:hypothetical protein